MWTRITVMSQDPVAAKKRLTSRTTRYSGVLDLLHFEQVGEALRTQPYTERALFGQTGNRTGQAVSPHYTIIHIDSTREAGKRVSPPLTTSSLLDKPKKGPVQPVSHIHLFSVFSCRATLTTLVSWRQRCRRASTARGWTSTTTRSPKPC